MTATIRRLTDADLDHVVEFALRAWAPVFESMRGALGDAVYLQLYPDWRSMQARAVEQACRAATEAWVADVDGRPVGFAAVVHHDESYDEPCSGEIEMIAVDPDHQRRGVGDQLIAQALGGMRRAGLRLAVVATGGDPGHAPARALYERAVTGLPLVRYYQASDGRGQLDAMRSRIAVASCSGACSGIQWVTPESSTKR